MSQHNLPLALLCLWVSQEPRELINLQGARTRFLILFLACINYSECIPLHLSQMELGFSVSVELFPSNSCLICLSLVLSLSLCLITPSLSLKHTKQIKSVFTPFHRRFGRLSQEYWSRSPCVADLFCGCRHSRRSKSSSGVDKLGFWLHVMNSLSAWWPTTQSERRLNMEAPTACGALWEVD